MRRVTFLLLFLFLFSVFSSLTSVQGGSGVKFLLKFVIKLEIGFWAMFLVVWLVRLFRLC